MTVNERITKVAYSAARGTFSLPPESGMCLAATRMIVEAAVFDGRWEFYRWRTYPVERRSGAPREAFEPVARDMERSLVAAGMPLSFERRGRYCVPNDSLQPGDLLFRWDAAPWRWGALPFYGHVGILLEGGLVLENINPAFRPHSLSRGVVSVTPLDVFPFTSGVRFNPEITPA